MSDNKRGYVELSNVPEYFACPVCHGTGIAGGYRPESIGEYRPEIACKWCDGNGAVTSDRLSQAEIADQIRAREDDDRARNKADFA